MVLVVELIMSMIMTLYQAEGKTGKAHNDQQTVHHKESAQCQRR